MLVSPIFISVGSGLLYTISETTNPAKKMVGYEIIEGNGIGMGGAKCNIYAIKWVSLRKNRIFVYYLTYAPYFE